MFNLKKAIKERSQKRGAIQQLFQWLDWHSIVGYLGMQVCNEYTFYRGLLKDIERDYSICKPNFKHY